jgi:hypothetical protein
VCKVTEVMERKGANCLRVSGLDGIYRGITGERWIFYLRSIRRKAGDKNRDEKWKSHNLKFGHFGEIEVADPHRGNDHIE